MRRQGFETVISVIVPVYQAEAYLQCCIDSILSQTFPDLELILVDDGSTEKSGIICDQYAMKDRRVRVIHQHNRGQAMARNAAVKCAQGEYICFVDADDMIHPQLLEILASAVKGKKEIAACALKEDVECPQSFFERTNKPQFVSCHMDEKSMSQLFEDPYICWVACGKLIPAEIIKKYPFAADRYYEDNAVVAYWLYEAGKIFITDLPLYFYRINRKGITKSTQTDQKRIDHLWALSSQMSFFEENNMQFLLHQRMQHYLVTGADLGYEFLRNNQPELYQNVIELLQHWWIYSQRGKCLSNQQRKYVHRVFHPYLVSIRLTTKKIITDFVPGRR